MEIQINREKRLLLLKWLKQGFIEWVELSMLYHNNSMTREEIEKELDYLAKVNDGKGCERYKRLGLCKYANRMNK